MELKLDQTLSLANKRLKEGSTEEAKRIYQDILAKFPNNKKAKAKLITILETPIANVKKAQDPTQDQLETLIKLYSQGKLQQALIQANNLLMQFRNTVILYNILGAIQAGLKQYDAAISSYGKAIKLKPNYAEAHNNLGNALINRGDPGRAIDSYKRAIKIKPDYAEAHNNIGNALKEKGDLGTAIVNYRLALSIDPNYVLAHYNMGAALRQQGDLDMALDSYGRAIKIKPDYAEAHYNMGVILKVKGNAVAALDSYRQAIKIKPNYAEAHNNMGNVLMDDGDLSAAIDSFSQAIKIRPNYAEPYKNMGAALMDQGDLDAATHCFKSAIKIKPDYADAHRNLSNITKYTPQHAHLSELEKLHQSDSLTDTDRCKLSFALAKAYEDIGEFGQAFSYFTAGNALRKFFLGYSIEQDQNLFFKLREEQPSMLRNALKLEAGDKGFAPVFILGMPRSGTTLVEQIISSHSDVTAAGELSDISRYGALLAQGESEVTSEALLQFRQSYLRELIKRSDGARFITDKMPLNFRYIALICAAFPEAKIIHVQRDATATCWSNYKNYFAAKGLGYCYDLSDLSIYYKLYMDLMSFWQTAYGTQIYTLDYEKLTTDQDVETRSLIEYTGLEWEDACLYPQKNNRAVRTASQQQVRKKIYQDSSKKWLKYQRFINGAFDGLDSLQG